MSTHHVLKTWPEPFQAIWEDRKKAEYRKNDRGFRLGDYLELLEYDPQTETFSGREIIVKVTDIRSGPSPFGIPEGYAMLSIELISRRVTDGDIEWEFTKR